jgi:hypothetical protein
MQKKTLKVASRTVASLAVGMALTIGSASVAFASGDHSHSNESSNHDCASGKISSFDYAKVGVGGYVTAVTSTSVTVQEWNGTSSTFALTSSTTFSEGSSPTTAASLVVGDRVMIGTTSSAPATATSVNIELAELFGKVTALSGNTITISDPQGFSRTIVVSAATTYTNAGVVGTLTNVVVGSAIFARGTIDANGTSLDAVTIAIGTASHKEFVGGVVTAVTSSSVTVQGRDGTLTTFTYSATTTFKEGATALSASDVTVGERVGIESSSDAPTVALSVQVMLTHEFGTVTAISGDTITIKNFKGMSNIIVVSADTTYTSGKVAGTVGDVVVGAKIGAEGTIASDGTTLDALNVSVFTVASPVTMMTPMFKQVSDFAHQGSHGLGVQNHTSFGQGHASFKRDNNRR